MILIIALVTSAIVVAGVSVVSLAIDILILKLNITKAILRAVAAFLYFCSGILIYKGLQLLGGLALIDSYVSVVLAISMFVIATKLVFTSPKKIRLWYKWM